VTPPSAGSSSVARLACNFVSGGVIEEKNDDDVEKEEQRKFMTDRDNDDDAITYLSRTFSKFALGLCLSVFKKNKKTTKKNYDLTNCSKKPTRLGTLFSSKNNNLSF